jgi:tetratricopeptide (TPR) repeat protein
MEYEAAIELFLEAYEMRPEPNYLFNVGRVYEQKGDMKNAVDYYTRFLREPEVDIKAREVALERRRVLTAVLDDTEPGWRDEPQDEPESQDEPASTEDTTDDVTDDDTTSQPPPDKPRNKLRIAGYVLLGVGGAGLITGAAFAGVASSNAKELDTLDTLGARDDAIARGTRNALVADVMFLSGAVIALTGLTLVLVSLKKKPSATARARILPTVGPSGAGVGAVVRF